MSIYLWFLSLSNDNKVTLITVSLTFLGIILTGIGWVIIQIFNKKEAKKKLRLKIKNTHRKKGAGDDETIIIVDII
jgi:hypothetical protein